MATEPLNITGSFLVKPGEVEYQLGKAAFKYPSRKEADENRGWSRYGVIPGLFGLMVQTGRFPSPDIGVRFLMQHIDPFCRVDDLVRRRADKLYLDFARDMHTLGLLQAGPLFGTVNYQKVLDLGFNVDFVASLLSQLQDWLVGVDPDVAIQAKMRARWFGSDYWDEVKKRRREGRGDREWQGRIYELTNKMRPPAKRVAGCWLFGPLHIRDLVDEVRSDLGLPPEEGGVPAVAIVQQMELF